MEAVYSSTSGPADDANEGIEGGSSVRGSFSFKVTPMVSDVEHVSALTRADVRCIMLGLLHAADIGNCVKPVDLHVAWSVKVVREVRRPRRARCVLLSA